MNAIKLNYFTGLGVRLEGWQVVYTNIENLSESEVHKLCPLKENKKEFLVLVKLDFPAQLVHSEFG